MKKVEIVKHRRRVSLVGIITLGVTYGTRNTFGLFLRPVAKGFGASRGSISLTVSINFLCYGAVIFGVGWLIDRFGPRVVLVWGMCLGALAWWAGSLAGSPVFFIATFGIVFGLAVAMLSQVTCTSLVSKYVADSSGSLLGFIGMGPGVGQFIFTPILSALIVFFSWRWAMGIVGVLFLTSLLLPGLALRGIQPVTAGEHIESKQMNSISECLPLIRQTNFLLLFICFMSLGLGVYPYLTQVAACAADRGLGPGAGALALASLGGTGVLASPLAGWATTRLGNIKLVGITIFLLAVVGMVVIRFAGSTGSFFLSSVLLGIGYGGYVPVLPALAMTIYPRTLFGRIWSLITVGGCIGAALGSWIGGFLFDLAGNYNWAWWLGAIAWGFAAATLLLTRVPTPVTDDLERAI